MSDTHVFNLTDNTVIRIPIHTRIQFFNIEIQASLINALILSSKSQGGIIEGFFWWHF